MKKKTKKIKSGPVAQLAAVLDRTKEAPKYDDGKLMFELLMPGPLRQIVAVLTFGAKKYGPNTYRRGLRWSRYVGAALRHIWTWYGGETNDPESGLHHLAHAVCCLLFLLDFEDIRPKFDDRPGDSPFKRSAEKYDRKHGWTP